jgi:hypothetical protein
MTALSAFASIADYFLGDREIPTEIATQDILS